MADDATFPHHSFTCLRAAEGRKIECHPTIVAHIRQHINGTFTEMVTMRREMAKAMEAQVRQTMPLASPEAVQERILSLLEKPEASKAILDCAYDAARETLTLPKSGPSR